MIRIFGAMLLATTFSFLTACGGGGASSPTPATSMTPTKLQDIEFSVPRSGTIYAASSSRKTSYISAATATVAIKLAYGYAANAPTAYAHTFNVATDCPVPQGSTRAICTVGLSSLTPPPAGYDDTLLSAVGTAYDSHGVVVSQRLNNGTAACGNPFSTVKPLPGSFPVRLETCTIPFAGVISVEAISQAQPLIAGTPGSTAIVPTFVDPDGFVIADDPASSINTCLMASTGDQVHQGISFADPHLTLATTHPYISLTVYHQPMGGCTDGSVIDVSNTPLTNPQPPTYLGVNALLSPSDTMSLAYDGIAEAPTTATFSAVIAPVTAAPAYNGPSLTYTPIIVPKNYVTIPTSGTSQTLTVPVPVGYSGAVSISVTSCLRSKAVAAFPGFSTAASSTNATASPLVSVSPASATPATPGASVSFTVSSLGADTGACTLTSTADATTYGAVVAW